MSVIFYNMYHIFYISGFKRAENFWLLNFLSRRLYFHLKNGPVAIVDKHIITKRFNFFISQPTPRSPTKLPPNHKTIILIYVIVYILMKFCHLIWMNPFFSLVIFNLNFKFEYWIWQKSSGCDQSHEIAISSDKIMGNKLFHNKYQMKNKTFNFWLWAPCLNITSFKWAY